MIKVDLKGFSEVIKGLHKISGKRFSDVIKSEAGMILAGAMRSTPKASKKNIVRHNMPESYKFEGILGEKKVISRFGKKYHIGQPVLAGYQPDERGRARPQGASRHWKPKRGGKIWKHPHPKQPWMGKAMWNEFIESSKIKTLGRLANRGMSAAQFGFMADLIGVKIVSAKARPNYLQTDHLRTKLRPFLSPRTKGSKRLFEIILESKGLEQTKRTGAGQKLDRAVQRRVTAYRKAIRKEWFNDIKHNTKSYPLLFK